MWAQPFPAAPTWPFFLYTVNWIPSRCQVRRWRSWTDFILYLEGIWERIIQGPWVPHQHWARYPLDDFIPGLVKPGPGSTSQLIQPAVCLRVYIGGNLGLYPAWTPPPPQPVTSVYSMKTGCDSGLWLKDANLPPGPWNPVKGIVSRDFLPPFFFIKLILLGPWFMG